MPAEFYNAFSEIVTWGKHPDCPSWLTRKHPYGEQVVDDEKYQMMIFPFTEGERHVAMSQGFSDMEQSSFSLFACHADISWIAENCRTPDWAGYLGLVLLYTGAHERKYQNITKAWVPQILGWGGDSDGRPPYWAAAPGH